MNKRFVLMAAAVVLAASGAFAGDHAWYNPSKCAMCTAMVSVPGLMEATHCEQLNLSNGIVSVTNIEDRYLEGYRDAHAKMMEVAARLEKGETVEMCGSCMAFGDIMKKGVKQEYVQTQGGDIWIVTSETPAVATELQAWAKRNMEEMAKMKTSSGKMAKAAKM
jgi:hypothetical protein